MLHGREEIVTCNFRHDPPGVAGNIIKRVGPLSFKTKLKGDLLTSRPHP